MTFKSQCWVFVLFVTLKKSKSDSTFPLLDSLHAPQLQIHKNKEGNLHRHFKECFYLLKEPSIELSIYL